MLSARQRVELFHLLFLQQLGKRLDKRLYAIKGGCNLRFFFKSIRYSEDLDIDTQVIARETLQKKVNSILVSAPFEGILLTRGMVLTQINESKQTDTTQRWKLQLSSGSSSLPLNTKIEFSRHGIQGETLFETIDVDIVREYQLFPPVLNHYSMEAAYHQKVSALIHRTETQARDIFDLYLLATLGVVPVTNDLNLIRDLSRAKENALSVSFGDFKSQVLSYFDEGNNVRYDDKSIWQQIQGVVIQNLGKSNEIN